MFTPNQESGDNTDKVMLLSMWADVLKKEGTLKSLILAGMGKPTYPINYHMVQTYLQYWNEIVEKLNSELPEGKNAAIGYGNPCGDMNAKEIMAGAMSRWYGTEISPENILFTVGGAGALRVVFETFNKLNEDIPAYRVITPFPHYTLYGDNRHQLHPVDVMSQPGYNLTGKVLQESIENAYKLARKDNNVPVCILLCNPNNPLGTVISKETWDEIIPILRKYSNLKIVIDEAYAEMCWSEVKIPSLIALAPDIKERVIILRSATKAHSAAGERMAMLLAFDKNLMTALTSKNIGMICHPPRSAQIAYAHAMDLFGEEEANNLRNYYKPQVDYVSQRLIEMGAALPDSSYQNEGTFYAMADLSDLMGTTIHPEARRALGNFIKIKTSEELAYSLLFQESLMLAPGEYFGLPKEKGYFRITCSSSSFEELQEMMDRLELVLFTERKHQYQIIVSNIEKKLAKLEEISPREYAFFKEKFSVYSFSPAHCKECLEKNQELKKLLSAITVVSKRLTSDGKNGAAKVIQSFFKKNVLRKQKNDQKNQMEEEWRLLIDKMIDDGPMKNYFLSLPVERRLDFKPWKEFLKKKDANPEISNLKI